MENKNGKNRGYFDNSKNKNKEKEVNKKDKLITIYTMKTLTELELIWNKIILFSNNILKKDILIKFCDLLSQHLKDELK